MQLALNTPALVTLSHHKHNHLVLNCRHLLTLMLRWVWSITAFPYCDRTRERINQRYRMRAIHTERRLNGLLKVHEAYVIWTPWDNAAPTSCDDVCAQRRLRQNQVNCSTNAAVDSKFTWSCSAALERSPSCFTAFSAERHVEGIRGNAEVTLGQTCSKRNVFGENTIRTLVQVLICWSRRWELLKKWREQIETFMNNKSDKIWQLCITLKRPVIFLQNPAPYEAALRTTPAPSFLLIADSLSLAKMLEPSMLQHVHAVFEFALHGRSRCDWCCSTASTLQQNIQNVLLRS